MRFLFTTIPGSGHFHPLVPTARALQRRGHDVAFAASPTFAPAIEAAGFEAHPAGPVWLERMSDPVMQKILAGEFFIDLIRMGMVEGVIRAVTSTGADAIVRGSGGEVELLQRDIADWRITFVDTGLNANVGQRLRAVRKHVGDEPFLANYGDVLTDAPLDDRINRFMARTWWPLSCA